ncbi:MAG: peptide chain release factor N(5)-glutamine methyltransferase [Sporichthyaceae bacterium]
MSEVQAAIRSAAALLAQAGVPSPRHDAEELAAFVLGVDRRDLIRHTGLDVERFDALVSQRAERRPLQHLTGRAYFRHNALAVGPGVFIPRPETEVMVGQVIDWCRALEGPARIVDLCTGSGVIALAIATEVRDAQVHAVELDPGAHAWAERNLAGTNVDLRLGDAGTAFAELDGLVDVVVANPPYIPMEAWESVAVEARDHDPGLALWGGGRDGLDLIRAVERSAARLLRLGGRVAVEHADAQGTTAPAVFAATGAWREVADHTDLAGRDRYVSAIRTGASPWDACG